jgi:hypothetical protein
MLLVCSFVAFVYMNHLFVSAVLSAGATLVFFFSTVSTSTFSFVQLQHDVVGNLIPGTNSLLDNEPVLLSKLVLVLLVLLPSCAISFILVALQTVKLRLTWDVLAKRLAAEQKTAAKLARDLAASRCQVLAAHAQESVLAAELSMAQHIRTVFAHIRNSNVDPSAEKRELTHWLQGQISEYILQRAQKQDKATKLARAAAAAIKARRAPDAPGLPSEPSSNGSTTTSSSLGGVGADHHDHHPPARPSQVGNEAKYVPGSPLATKGKQLSVHDSHHAAGDASLGSEHELEDTDLPGSINEEDATGEFGQPSLIERLNAAVAAAKVPFFLTDSVAGAYVAQAAAHNFSSENSYFLACDFFYARYCLLRHPKGSGSSSSFAAERARVARMLYAMFIAERAPFQINIAGSVRATLEKNVNNVGGKSAREASELFAPVRTIVCDLIGTNLLTNLNEWDATLIKNLQAEQQQAAANAQGQQASAAGGAAQQTSPVSPLLISSPASPSAVRGGSLVTTAGPGSPHATPKRSPPSAAVGSSPSGASGVMGSPVSGATVRLHPFPLSNGSSDAAASAAPASASAADSPNEMATNVQLPQVDGDDEVGAADA